MTKNGAVLGCLLALSISSLSAQTWKGTIVKDGDVVVVKNPKTPIYPTGALRLKEEVRIGGDNTNPDATLGLFAHIEIDPSGRIYVPDLKDSRIKIYDKNGVFLRAFGGKGQGPGEFRLVSELVLSPSGDSIYAVDVLKLVVFSPSGEFQRSIPVPERWTQARTDSQGRFFAESSYRGSVSWIQSLKRHDTIVDKGVVVREWPGLNEARPSAFPARPAWDLDGHDRLYLGHGGEYRIDIFDAMNRLIRRIEKADNQVPVSSEDKAKHRNSLPESLRSQPTEYESKFPFYYGFLVDEKGRVLVHTYKKLADADLFDLFDEDGRFIAEIGLPSYVLAFRDNKIYTREYDSEGYLIVKRYAMEWKK
jgi:hypothetical protein